MKDQTAYLEFVLEKLRERIQKISLSLAEGEKEIEGMHEYYWENYTEMDQYGYENFDNQQALLNQINTNQQQLKMKHRFKNMLDSPYFGRVDFQYEGEDEPETFYIGIGNFAEETGRTPLIYDWRAPVSGLFYDFDKGEASYQAPGGLMEGEITSKWQYKIRKGKMVYGFESDMKIDDDILKAELGANGDVQLKNIIRTIQKEQNAIIRNTKDRILVIQGVAGSGKTSVALHRIAYLLYHDRKQMIEQAMKDLAVGERCREKQSGEFLDQMEEFLLILEDELMNFTNVEYRHYQIPSSRIIELFYEKFLDVPLLSRIEAVMEYLLDEYETLTGRDLSEEERPVFQEKFLKMYETRDLYRIYSRFLEYAGYAPLQSSWEQRLLAYEDVYPMLYMKYKLLRPGNRRNIKHLVIDEMQDYSRMQYLILAKLFPCKMTILGDKAQTMDEKMQDVTRFLPKVLGKDIRIIQMNKSYRNTVEIAEYAGKLAGMTDMELFERHGKPVEEKKIVNREEALEKILQNLKLGEEEYETAAVLTMTQEEAGKIYRQLKEKLGEEYSISYVDRDSSSFQKGITVTTFYLAKGLEFDQVFTLHPGEESGMITQAKYICATRALHELYMYEVEE